MLDHQRLCAALFLSLMTVIYAPQISSLAVGTLHIGILLVVSFLAPCLLFLVGHTKITEISTEERFYRIFSSATVLAQRIVRADWYSSTLAAVCILAVGFAIWLIASFSNFGWDGWAYHSSAIAWFTQHDRITGGSMPLMQWITVYPKNLELLSLWIKKLSGSDQFIEAGNLLIHVFALPFAYGVGRHCGLNKYWAATAAMVYFLTPEIMSQTWATMIDGAFSDSLVMLLFLSLSWHASNNENELFWSVLLGLGIGHAMHSKGLGLYVAVILGCFLLARLVIERDTHNLSSRLLLVMIFATLSGAGWYIKNWYVYGNPLYPFEVAVPGTSIILFGGTSLQKLIEPSSSGDYGSVPVFWLYLSHFAGTSYHPGWGLHFFFLGLPAMVFTIFHNRNLTWLVLFAIAYFWVVPFSFESRYSLLPALAGAVAFGFLSQEMLNTKAWQRFLQAVSVFTIALSLLTVVSIFGRHHDNISHVDFPWRDGLRRFALVREKPGATVGIVNLGVGADNPYWYFYFGPKWENKVEGFDPQSANKYDFVVCDFSQANCPSLLSHSLALVEQTVAVYKKDG